MSSAFYFLNVFDKTFLDISTNQPSNLWLYSSASKLRDELKQLFNRESKYSRVGSSLWSDSFPAFTAVESSARAEPAHWIQPVLSWQHMIQYWHSFPCSYVIIRENDPNSTAVMRTFRDSTWTAAQDPLLTAKGQHCNYPSILRLWDRKKTAAPGARLLAAGLPSPQQHTHHRRPTPPLH